MRPLLVVATMNPYLADGCAEVLRGPCAERGVRLKICPGAAVRYEYGTAIDISDRAYACVDELFEFLESLDLAEQSHTQVWFDISDYDAPLDAFRPRRQGSGSGWPEGHAQQVEKIEAGAELLLRFPLIFPVFLGNFPVFLGNDCKEERRWRECFGKCFQKPNTEGSDLRGLPDPSMIRRFHFTSIRSKRGDFLAPLERFAEGFRCYFDPTGIRTLVKRYILGNTFGSVDTWPPVPSGLDSLGERMLRTCVVVEDQFAEAVANGYCAWRKGYCTWIVTSYAAFQWAGRNLGSGDSSAAGNSVNPGLRSLLIRDIDLRFKDYPAEEQGTRENLWRLHKWRADADGDVWYKDWDVRVVTAADEYYIEPSAESNSNVAETTGDHAQGPKPYELLPKPLRYLHEPMVTEGFFPDDSKEGRQDPGDRNTRSRKKSSRQISFLSMYQPVRMSSDIKVGHSAPYQNSEIARFLVRQSDRHSSGPATSILRGLLAHEAYELLLGMSRTTALEALSALHRAEIRAECSFYGISGDLSVNARATELEQTLHTLIDRPKYDASTTRDHGVVRDRSYFVKGIFLARLWGTIKADLKEAELFTASDQANRLALAYASRAWMQRGVDTVTAVLRKIRRKSTRCKKEASGLLDRLSKHPMAIRDFEWRLYIVVAYPYIFGLLGLSSLDHTSLKIYVCAHLPLTVSLLVLVSLRHYLYCRLRYPARPVTEFAGGLGWRTPLVLIYDTLLPATLDISRWIVRYLVVLMFFTGLFIQFLVTTQSPTTIGATEVPRPIYQLRRDTCSGVEEQDWEKLQNRFKSTLGEGRGTDAMLSVYKKTFYQVSLSSFKIDPRPGLLPLDECIESEGALFRFYIFTFLLFMFSYGMLGILISIIFRKLTRS